MEERAYWNKRYAGGGNSGYGSYGEQLDKKLRWLAPLEFLTVSEVGCGDFNFGQSLLAIHPAAYVGMDISETIVFRNQEKYPEHLFVQNQRPIPHADLVMCVDVLFHIMENKDVENLLSDLEKAWTKYLVLTAYEYDEEKSNHVRIRKFDYKRFGEPIIREVVEENGQLYFYVFRR